MSRILCAVFGLLLLGSLSLSDVAAQSLETGTWTGYIQPPDSDRLPVTYDVRMESDTLKIDISNEQMGTLPLRGIELSNDEMRFMWSPGVDLQCRLRLKANKGYEGECAPEGGESGSIVMNPPVRDNRP
jgi:hypothetical protein